MASDLARAVNNATGVSVTDEQIYNNISKDMQEPLPMLERGSSFIPTGQTFTAEPRKFYDYMDTVATKYGLVFIANAVAKNPLIMFKRGQIPYGGKIESIVFDIIAPKTYRPDLIEGKENPFAVEFGRVLGDTYVENMDIESANTILDTQDTMKFQNLEQFHSFVFGKISALVNGAKLQEFFTTKLTVSKAIADGLVTQKTFKADDLRDFQKKLLYYPRKFQYFSRGYNAGGVAQATTVDNIVVLLPLERSINLDVDFVANAFNAELFTNTKVQVVEIDEFPSIWKYKTDHVVTQADITKGYISEREHAIGSTIEAGSLATPEATGATLVLDGSKVGAMILDKDALQLWDNLPLTLSTQANTRKRYTNIFLNQKTSMMFVQNLNSVVLMEED